MMRWTDEAKAEFKAMWLADKPEREIMEHFGITRNSILGLSTRMNLPWRGRQGPHPLAPNHPAVVNGTTKYPMRVYDPETDMLKPGSYSRKLGAQVTKGAWKGMPIYSLTLEERATCPRSCALWRGCYGNGMVYAKRFRVGPDLMVLLHAQLQRLSRAHTGGFVVRLHILGDFYSPAYALWWGCVLDEFPGLRIFGYTAWPEKSKIGRAIGTVRAAHPDHFKIRTSGATSGYRTIVVDHEDDAPSGSIVCPVETGKTLSCATCALCWSTEKIICFLRH